MYSFQREMEQYLQGVTGPYRTEKALYYSIGHHASSIHTLLHSPPLRLALIVGCKKQIKSKAERHSASFIALIAPQDSHPSWYPYISALDHSAFRTPYLAHLNKASCTLQDSLRSRLAIEEVLPFAKYIAISNSSKVYELTTMASVASASCLAHPLVPMPTDDVITETSTEQVKTEQEIRQLLSLYIPQPVTGNAKPKEAVLDINRIELNRSAHVKWLSAMLGRLPPPYVTLDASRPWLIYWVVQSMAIMNVSLDPNGKKRAVETLKPFFNKKQGGFGGGPGQMAHLAPTFASVSALAYLDDGTGSAWDWIDRCVSFCHGTQCVLTNFSHQTSYTRLDANPEAA